MDRQKGDRHRSGWSQVRQIIPLSNVGVRTPGWWWVDVCVVSLAGMCACYCWRMSCPWLGMQRCNVQGCADESLCIERLPAPQAMTDTRLLLLLPLPPSPSFYHYHHHNQYRCSDSLSILFPTFYVHLGGGEGNAAVELSQSLWAPGQQ